MAKIPLKQLSVNTFESNRLVSCSTKKKNASVMIDVQPVKKKGALPKPMEPASNTIDTILQAGSRMTTDEFDAFVKKMAPDSYWHIMAEHYRLKLADVTRENQQLHEIVDGLNKDNENLRAIADHCEYLTEIIEKLTSDDDDNPTAKTSVRVRLF